MAAEKKLGRDYVKLLRGNKPLFFVWQGTLISSLGDWCRHVSILALVINLTGTGLEMALVLILEMIPLVFLSPFAIGFIDRCNAVRVLASLDIVRALLVLGLLTVHSASDMWLVYLITISISIMDIFSQATQQKLICVIVRSDTLLQANSLFCMTSGISLATGTFVATLIMGVYGYVASFLFDAFSFLFAGLMVLRIKVPKYSIEVNQTEKMNFQHFLSDIKSVLRYLKVNSDINSLILMNVLRYFGSGLIYLLLGVFGTRVYEAGDLGIGLFYACFGSGFFLGGLVAKTVGEKIAQNHYISMIGIAALLEGLFIMIFSQIGQLPFSLLILGNAYLSRGMFITFYDNILMKKIRETFLGRVFMVEKILSYSMMSLAMFIGVHGLDILTPRILALITGLYLCLNGARWLFRTRSFPLGPGVF